MVLLIAIILQVRLLLLPHKRQKFKSKIRQAGEDISFDESFSFSRISPGELIEKTKSVIFEE